jgi:hypothetical protein
MLLKLRKRSVCYLASGENAGDDCIAKWKWIILYDFLIAL